MVLSGIIFDAACDLSHVQHPCQISCRMRNDSRVISHPFSSHSHLCDSWTYWTLVLYNLDNIAVILSNSRHVQNLSYSTTESELHLSIKSSHWQGSKRLSHLFIVAASMATLSSCMTSISHSRWYILRMSLIVKSLTALGYSMWVRQWYCGGKSQWYRVQGFRGERKAQTR